MTVKLIVADDNQTYWAIVDSGGEVRVVVSPQDTSGCVSGEVAALTRRRG